MKPKDLKYPFSWEERKPFLQGNVFFAPAYFHEHEKYAFPPFESEEVFGNDHPIYLEYCSGNGTWIAEKARLHPNINWIAVEMDFERVRKIWSKSQNYELKNLFVICGEAQTFTKHYLHDNTIEQVYVNFPDPWPKEKHIKHRLFQLPFVYDMSRVVKPEKKAIFATDDQPYSEQMIQVMLDSTKWTPCFREPHFVTEWEDYGTSFFDELWREKGKTIRYIQMLNKLLDGEKSE